MFFFQYYRYIQIAIKQCKSSGIDCKIHGLTILGRVRRDDEDSAASFSFLASDNEEEEERVVQPQNLLQRKVKVTSSKDIQTHVFVWGLNDKDQLGGPKGSKVIGHVTLGTITGTTVLMPIFNSLWPSDAIWRHGTRSTLAQ